MKVSTLLFVSMASMIAASAAFADGPYPGDHHWGPGPGDGDHHWGPGPDHGDYHPFPPGGGYHPYPPGGGHGSYPGPYYPGPSYPAPSYPAPSYPAPSYPAPSYPAPSYPAPVPTYPVPSYPTPSYPAPTYGDGLQTGNEIVAIDSSRHLQIAARQFDGRFVLRDYNGNTYPNIDRSDIAVEVGCQQGICVNQEIVAVDSSRELRVVALQSDGRFVLGDSNGNLYVNIDVSDLAVESGCSQGVCAGQPIIAIDSSRALTVIALQRDGRFILRDDNGNLYANIDRNDIAIESGCSGYLCAGQRAIALDSGKNVTVIAVQPDGRFVVRDDYGNIYANIDQSDLARR